MESNWLIYALMAAAVASVHLWFPWFDRRFAASENKWVSITGGVAVVYVCLYMLPKLSNATARMIESQPDAWEFWQYRIYLMLLAGLLADLSIERAKLLGPEMIARVRYIEFAILALYDFLVGYVISEFPGPGVVVHALVSIVLGLHLMGMVHGFRVKHRDLYDRGGRWVAALLVAGGYLTGALTELPWELVMQSTALVAGFILVNVIAEELPRGRENRLRWFMVGVASSVVIIALLRSIPQN